MTIYKESSENIPYEPITMENVKNAEYKVVIGEKQYAPNFIMRIFKIQQNGHTPLHAHEWEHENYVISGTGGLRNSKGEKLVLKPGDVILIPPFEEHQYFNENKEPFVFMCLIPKQKK